MKQAAWIVQSDGSLLEAKTIRPSIWPGWFFVQFFWDETPVSRVVRSSAVVWGEEK